MKSSIGIYLLPDRLVVLVMSTTTAGVWIRDGEPIVLDRQTSNEELGKLIRASLAKSRHGIRHPEQSEWKEFGGVLLRASGIRSHAQFSKNALTCDVSSDDDDLVQITPYKAESSRGAFAPLNDRKMLLDSPSDAEIAQCVQQAFEIERQIGY